MNKVEKFLQDMSLNSKFRILEEAKDKDELAEIAKKRGIKVPCNDLAIFKCVYAYVDRMNKNGCTLPKEEVEKALDTLAGKAVDYDHIRKQVVGFWLDAQIIKDEIVAWGAFFKGNFSEDYYMIKEMMEKDVLAISFEAWGDRRPEEVGYSLTDIQFAGGALLIKEKPAFPGSEVLEMSKQRFIEMASICKEPKEYVKSKEQNKTEIPEEARYYWSDIQNILQMLGQVDCLNCKEKGMVDLLSLDFKNNYAKTRCLNCESEMNIDLTPVASLSKRGRKIKKIEEVQHKCGSEEINSFIASFENSDEEMSCIIENSFEEIKKISNIERKNLDDNMFAVVKTAKIGKDKEKKIRMFPIHDPAHVKNALAKLGQSKVNATLEKLGVSIDNVKQKILKRAKVLNMKELLERYKKASIEEVLQEIAKAQIQRELTGDELDKAKANFDKATETVKEEDVKTFISSMIKEAEEAKIKAEKEATEKAKMEADKKASVDKDAEIAKLTKEVELLSSKVKEFETEKAKVEEAKKQEKIKARKDELGEFAKDMKDEDLIDDSKYEVAKLKKENAELKAGKSTNTTATPDLTKGSADKNIDKEISNSRDKIRKRAFGQ